MKPDDNASTRCVYSTIELRSTPGTTSPLQNGQPWKPEPAGPQPRPESETRTTPPRMISDEGGDERGEGELRRTRARQQRYDAARRERLRRGSPPASLASATSRRMSFIGSTLRTRGITSKLFGGGGEVVNHSSVLPCQGSLPAALAVPERCGPR